MRPKLVWIVVTTLVLVNEWYINCCHGCLVEERIGLLEIKAWVNSPNGTFLLEWKEDTDCCQWPEVKCNSTTKRVIQLSLEYTREFDSAEFYVNATLFLPFEELKSLDLSGNKIVGFLPDQGFEVLSPRLTKLERLDMRANSFEGQISLNGLSSLKYFDLTYNRFLIGFKAPSSSLTKLEFLSFRYCSFDESSLSSLSGLRSLKKLDLSYTSLTGSTGFNSLYNLTTIEELFLDNVSLPLNFLEDIGALSALRILSVKESNLNGTLPAQGWCELKNLEQLYLFSNELEGLLPACLGNLSSLQLLDVSYNQLIGNIATSPLTNLVFLKYLSLSDNKFQIPVSFTSFMNHSNLKFLSCDDNNLIPEPSSQNSIAKFQLMFFSLTNCNPKAFVLEFPNFLYNQYDLRVLDISQNNFTGMFPSWLLENNTRLEQLYLRDNSFVGSLQFPHHPNSNLSKIDLSYNKLHGQFSSNTCMIFPNLGYVRMANIGLTGSIPACFGNMSSLEALDLADNQISDANLDRLTSLWYLKLSNNNLDEQIPPSFFNSCRTGHLYLDGNKFGQLGDVSSISIRCAFLTVFDISNNLLTGTLPRWIGNLSDLQAIDLSENHFHGPIPEYFCNFGSLEFLDLSENSLTGSIPPCFNPPQLSHIHLYKNQLSGPLTNAFLNSSYLVTLDLSNNNFSGSIPSWIGNLSALSVLLLKDNHFSGGFPVQLCLLEVLSMLDISHNNLFGPLSSCLANLTFVANQEKSFVPIAWPNDQLYDQSNFISMGLPQVGDYYRPGNKYANNIADEAVEFQTKRQSYSYKGNILTFMSGIDFSCNEFTGEIPPEFGLLSEIRALNLSYNNLTGSIPANLSNLKQIESLDLSHNNLTGIIPWQLTDLNTLEVFSVAYNNLSGKTPERKGQFITFDESSYEGNPLLCGPPLEDCSVTEPPLQPVPNNEQDDFIDMDVFIVSFVTCYVIVVLAIAATLYINPYWRRRWFYFIEECISSCYCFVRKFMLNVRRT